jgi:hypothetical protein
MNEHSRYWPGWKPGAEFVVLIALYAITIVSVIASAGFAVAGLVRPTVVAPGQQTESSRIFALYTFARAVPVALVTLAAMIWAPVVMVLWLSALAGLIQLFDGYVGTQLKNFRTTWGPIAIGIVQFAVPAWVIFRTS